MDTEMRRTIEEAVETDRRNWTNWRTGCASTKRWMGRMEGDSLRATHAHAN
ncbi:MAG: hypothetical protein ABSE06_17500 [Anaerolineaceae bacterium]